MIEESLPTLDLPKDNDHVALKALLEKNLKWSQIIYEQNRKINSKLLWINIGGWFRAIVIVGPVILGIVFFPTLYKKFEDRYGALFGWPTTTTARPSASSVDDMLKVLPLTDAQKDQLRAMLK